MLGSYLPLGKRQHSLMAWLATLSIFLLLSATTILAAADFYKVLGVDRSASEKDIKRAYRKRAQKLHPDKHPDKHQEFIELSEAYQVLSDPETREIYNRRGEEAVKQYLSRKDNPHQAPHDPFDAFSRFFGGHPGGNMGVRKGPTKVFTIQASLDDFYNGKAFPLSHERNVVCSHCDGSGAESAQHIHTCDSCGGRGIRIVRQQVMPGFFTTAQMTCDVCSGNGKKITKKCSKCKGEKIVSETSEIEVELERGAKEGVEYVYEGESDEGPDFEAGDIIVKFISDREKGQFRRRDGALYITLPLSLADALLGFERNLTHMDGRTVRISRDSVTQPGFVSTIDDEGMPIPNTMVSDASDQDTRLGRDMLFGKLYVEWEVVLPQKVDKELKATLEKIYHKRKQPTLDLGHQEL